MSRRGQYFREPSAMELIFHCPCDGDNIDVVSGRQAVTAGSLSSSLWSNPVYVVDPADSSRRCMVKKSGTYYLPIICGLPGIETANGNYPVFYPVHNSTYQAETENVIFLDNHQGAGHRLEFSVYVGSNTTNRPFFMTGGLFNFNTNATQHGIEPGIYNGNIIIALRNNVSTTTVVNLVAQSQCVGKWINFKFDYTELTQTSYKCVVSMTHPDLGVFEREYAMRKPAATTRGGIYFFSDSFGNGNWCPNVYDYMKEVKIYKIWH